MEMDICSAVQRDGAAIHKLRRRVEHALTVTIYDMDRFSHAVRERIAEEPNGGGHIGRWHSRRDGHSNATYTYIAPTPGF